MSNAPTSGAGALESAVVGALFLMGLLSGLTLGVGPRGLLESPASERAAVVPTMSVSDRPATEPVECAGTDEHVGGPGVVDADRAPVRSAPDRSSPVLVLVERGTWLNIVREASGWYLVRLSLRDEERCGWVKVRLVAA